MEQKKQHYVDNKLFFAEMEKWKAEIDESDEVDDLPPMVTEYMGECFYKIATHLSYRPNTSTKTYDIMEGDDDVYSNTYMEFLRDNLEEKDIPKQKRKKSKKGIEHFIEELNENEI